MMVTSGYTLPQTHRTCNTRREPESKLWVIVTPSGKFTGFNKCFPLVGMLIMGKAMHVQGQRVYRKHLYLPLNFAMNLKKKKVHNVCLHNVLVGKNKIKKHTRKNQKRNVDLDL